MPTLLGRCECVSKHIPYKAGAPRRARVQLTGTHGAGSRWSHVSVGISTLSLCMCVPCLPTGQRYTGTPGEDRTPRPRRNASPKHSHGSNPTAAPRGAPTPRPHVPGTPTLGRSLPGGRQHRDGSPPPPVCVWRGWRGVVSVPRGCPGGAAGGVVPWRGGACGVCWPPVPLFSSPLPS